MFGSIINVSTVTLINLNACLMNKSIFVCTQILNQNQESKSGFSIKF